jgi:hypothetical protein
MARRKSKGTGYAIMAALVGLGAWFHEPIIEQMHKMGIAKSHK